MKVVLPELLQYTAAEIVSSKLQKAKCKMLLKAPFKIALWWLFYVLCRENELLKHQLKKYVSAVQMLRRQGARDDGKCIDCSNTQSF